MLQLFSMSTENVILIAKLSDSNSTLTRNVNEEPNPSLLIKQKVRLDNLYSIIVVNRQ